MLRGARGTQRNIRVLVFKSVTAALTEGRFDGTLVKNSTGNYTITFAQAFARAPAVFASVRTSGDSVYVVTSTVSAVNIITTTSDQATPGDADWDLMVWGFDSQDAS